MNCMIDLYTAATPNGHKVSIALEELGLPYTLTVLDRSKGEQKLPGFLAGDYSIADIANQAWVRTHRWFGVDVDDLPHLQRWLAAIRARPAVQKGIESPPSQIDLTRDGDEKAKQFSEAARSMVEMGQSRTSGV